MDKKRVLFAVILGSLAIVAFAQRASDFRTARNSTGGLPGVTILGYQGDLDDVVIPAYIDGYPVTVIAEKAFYQTGLTSVQIPETVTTIRREAFAGNALRTITLPRETPTIDASAFDPSVAAALAESAQAAYAADERRAARASGAIPAGSASPAPKSTAAQRPAPAAPSAAKPVIRVSPPASDPGVQSARPNAAPKTPAVYVRNTSPMLRVEVVPPADYYGYSEEEEIVPSPQTGSPVYDPSTVVHIQTPYDSQSAASGRVVGQTQIVPSHSEGSEQYAVVLPPGVGTLYPDIHYQMVQTPQPYTQYAPYGQQPDTIPVLTQGGPPPAASRSDFTPSSPYGAYGISDYIDTSDYIINANIGRRTGTGSITAWRGIDASLEIPSTIDGVVITEIGKAVFSGRRLVEVYLPPTIVTIGEAAFNGNNLSFIDLPPSVRSIGSQAFAGNPISEINIGANVTIQPDTFGAAFFAIYNDSGRLPGRYVVNRNTWTMSNPTIY